MNPLGWTNFNLSPQGDGNSKVMFCSLGSVPDFNLSPQGDGNSFSLDNNIARTTFQLIPARGRKPKLRLRLARDLFISTYPRKGTETIFLARNLISLVKFQLIPARGRKRDADRIVDDRFDISTYPRKGTETARCRGRSGEHRISTYPRKNPLRRCAPALPKGELL